MNELWSSSLGVKTNEKQNKKQGGRGGGNNNSCAQALQVAVQLWLCAAARGCLHSSKASPALGAANWGSLLPVHTAPSFIFHANDGRETTCPRLDCCLCDFFGIGAELRPVFQVMVLRFEAAGGDPSTQRGRICAVRKLSASISLHMLQLGLCENICCFPLILSLGLCALL